MTSPELLQRLQAAWHVVPVAVSTLKAETGASSMTPAKRANRDCEPHVPPFDQVDEPDRTRSGWVRSRCRRCGRFLGYRLRTADVNCEWRG